MASSILMAFAMLQATHAAATETADRPPEKRICKSEKQVGSLARRKRVCRTREEWAAAASSAKQEVRDMQRTTTAPPSQ
jgi:hypothetical protein